MTQEAEIQAVVNVDQELIAAREYWANRDYNYNTKKRLWSDFTAERVLEFNRDRKSGELIETTPFSYSWDYNGLVRPSLQIGQFQKNHSKWGLI